MKQNQGARLLYSCLDMRRNLNQLLSNGNVSQGEYLVLRNIWRSSTDMNADRMQQHIKAANLSDALELSRPSITRILNSLEGRGLIKRNIDAKDRRSISIELTEDGINALLKAENALNNLTETLVKSLGDEDTDKLIELVDKLSEIYKELLQQGGNKDE